MVSLFSPLTIGAQSLDNRIVVPPMCQYSAIEGKPTDWHLMHYGSLSHSGAGLLIIEATAVCPEGRLSPFDLGLWDEERGSAMARLIQSIRKYSLIPIAVQLVHAGRKASMSPPWQGRIYVNPDEGGWETVGPSALAATSELAGAADAKTTYQTPKELTKAEIRLIVEQFAEAAKRADHAGIDIIELHGAHGYLLHQFLSPLSNEREDEYGGSLENRMRLTLEVFEAVRAVVPENKAVGIRISAVDWLEGGWDLQQSLQLAKKLDALGCSYIHVSTGGLDDNQQIPVGPNYQVPFAQAVKGVVKMPVVAVGLVTEPVQADAIISTGQADMVAIGRGSLFNPHWAWNAAIELGAQVRAPRQYLRSRPHLHKNLFK